MPHENLSGNGIGSKIFILSLIGTTLIACATESVSNKNVATSPQSSESPIQRKPASNSWGNYHWARTTPQFALKLGDNLTTSLWKFELAQASNDWNSPLAFGATSSPLLTAITAGGSNKRCSMVSGTTQVCNGKYGNNGWLGLASINLVEGSHIVQATAKMNDTYFSTATYNNPNERQHVICQEVAHTFGLDHQSTDGSSLNTCMDYFSNTGVNATSTTSTQPNAHDFDELNIIYGSHMDTSTTLAASTSSTVATSDVTDAPNSWGQLRSQTQNGRNSTYENVNQDGSMTETYVIWTKEAAARCTSCDHRDENH